jgi:methionine-S-sulfoxide reductase
MTSIAPIPELRAAPALTLIPVLALVVAVALPVASCSAAGPAGSAGSDGARAVVAAGQDAADAPEAAAGQRETGPRRSVATFAGGCFWCVEAAFEKVPGVLEVVSGYTGGSVEDPSYREVSSGGTGHVEAVQIWFDPQRVSYEDLLDVYWHNIDPTTEDRQFCDWGSQYGTAVFYHDDAQHRAAERTRDELAAARLDEPVVTRILPFTVFYPAEGYHQDFYKKSPLRYKFYRTGCGRDARLERLWGDQAYRH